LRIDETNDQLAFSTGTTPRQLDRPKTKYPELGIRRISMKLIGSLRLLLLAALLSIVPASSFAGVFISIGIAPPVMPVYEQPICPEDGYMWTPGYWAYGDDGYYWVPGAWVPAPQPGYLWTPPYWGFEGGHYLFHEGYWGSHVGYYGGVNYGFGYMGIGFAGGRWDGGHFMYNTAVVHVNTTIIRNVYVDRTIVERNTVVRDSHVAYSGGPGGIRHEPSVEERTFSAERHVPPTSVQTQHIQSAARDPQQHFSQNHGRPTTVAAARPLAAPVHAEASRPSAARPTPQARPEARPTPESRPAPQARPEARPTPESRPTPQARPETRPTPESRPAPQARPESRPAPQPHPAPKPESHPAPKPQHEEKPKGRGR
jgi:hypothetical protein